MMGGTTLGRDTRLDWGPGALPGRHVLGPTVPFKSSSMARLPACPSLARSALELASPENPVRTHMGTLFRCQHCPSEYVVEAHLISSTEKGKYHIILNRYIDMGKGKSPFEDYWPQLTEKNVIVPRKAGPGVTRCRCILWCL